MAAGPTPSDIIGWLKKISGTNTFLGQFIEMNTGNNGNQYSQFQDIQNAYGFWPLLVGCDPWWFNAPVGTAGQVNGLVSAGTQQNAKGGLITISWSMPNPYTGGGCADTSGGGNTISQSITAGTNANNNLNTMLDQCAQSILQLKTAGVSVMLRMFHEACGAWFWWGTNGGSNTDFKNMWQYARNRLINAGCTNVVWVCGNGSQPGNDLLDRLPYTGQCDLAGQDVYDPSAMTGGYNEEYNAALTTGLPTAWCEYGTDNGGNNANFDFNTLTNYLNTQQPKNTYLLFWSGDTSGNGWFMTIGKNGKQAFANARFLHCPQTISGSGGSQPTPTPTPPPVAANWSINSSNQLVVNNASLAAGDYTVNIKMTSAQVANSPQTYPVVVHVVAAQAASVWNDWISTPNYPTAVPNTKSGTPTIPGFTGLTLTAGAKYLEYQEFGSVGSTKTIKSRANLDAQFWQNSPFGDLTNVFGYPMDAPSGSYDACWGVIRRYAATNSFDVMPIMPDWLELRAQCFGQNFENCGKQTIACGLIRSQTFIYKGMIIWMEAQIPTSNMAWTPWWLFSWGTKSPNLPGSTTPNNPWAPGLLLYGTSGNLNEIDMNDCFTQASWSTTLNQWTGTQMGHQFDTGVITEGNAYGIAPYTVYGANRNGWVLHGTVGVGNQDSNNWLEWTSASLADGFHTQFINIRNDGSNLIDFGVDGMVIKTTYYELFQNQVVNDAGVSVPCPLGLFISNQGTSAFNGITGHRDGSGNLAPLPFTNAFLNTGAQGATLRLRKFAIIQGNMVNPDSFRV